MSDTASEPKETMASVDLSAAYPSVVGAGPRTIASLCERSHAMAKEKGWLEEKRSTASHMLLFVSEVIEGFEDYRNNRGVAEVYYEGTKPCGIPVELADVVIRVCQYSGTEGIAGDVAANTDGIERVETAGRTLDLETFMADLCKHFVDFRELLGVGDRAGASAELRDVLIETFELSAMFGIDLWAAIEVKEQFNRTRAHRHGGKRC